MNTKANPSVYDPLRTMDPNEPYFVICGHDPQGAEIVHKWAVDRLRRVQMNQEPASDIDKVTEALEIAQAMREYRAMPRIAAAPPSAEVKDE